MRSLIPILLAFLMATTARHALGCGTCNSFNGSALALPHPKAIEVAVATRLAIEQGILNSQTNVSRTALPDGGSGTVALRKIPATMLVEGWAETLARPASTGRSLAVHYFFIDTEESCGVLVRSGTVLFDRHRSFHADTHVVTTRTAFHALTSGDLTPREARRLGLLVVEGESAAEALVPGQSR